LTEIKYIPIQFFEPLDWQIPVLQDTTSKVLLLTGSAGGGKSRVCYEKLHAYALEYPGATIVAARKRREDAQKSVVLALDNTVIGKDPRVRHVKKEFSFIYENGSRIVYVGMKGEAERKAIRSIGQEGAIDMALMEEATEFEEEDFDEMNYRMRGTKGGWSQLMLATNPDAPLHWINVRLIIGGEARVIYSHARDNPHNPEDYQDTLDKGRGITRLRLRDGLWVSGTGQVIDTWLDDWNDYESTYKEGNVRPDAEYVENGGPIVLYADDGYSGSFDNKTRTFTKKSNPRVFLLAQNRGTGQIAVFYESYRVKTKVEVQLEALKDHCHSMGWPFPYTADYDKSAAHLEGEFQDYGFRFLRKSPANRDESIKQLREACDKDRNGWRQVIVHPRCQLLRLEMSSWSYDLEGRPEAWGDHGPDALRYGVWNFIRGPGKPVDIATPLTDEKIKARLNGVSDVYKRHMAIAAERLGYGN
jgi:phage terminase large subunit